MIWSSLWRNSRDTLPLDMMRTLGRKIMIKWDRWYSNIEFSFSFDVCRFSLKVLKKQDTTYMYFLPVAPPPQWNCSIVVQLFYCIVSCRLFILVSLRALFEGCVHTKHLIKAPHYNWGVAKIKRRKRSCCEAHFRYSWLFLHSFSCNCLVL